MGLTTAEGEVIIFLLVVFVIFLAGLFYLRKRFAERTRQLKGEIAESSARVEERAHNQIVLDEAELATLAREGFDLQRPKSSLDDARGAFDRKDFHHALQIAQGVHDSLVKMRRSSPISAPAEPAVPGGRAEPFGALAGSLALDGPLESDPGPSTESSASKPPLPKNRMESRFQITLLTEELIEAVRGRPDDARVAEANRLAAEAKSLEQRAEYTDALRIALKARRSLGGKVETLSLGQLVRSGGGEALPTDAGPGAAPAATTASPGPVSRASGSAGERDECASCHRPLRKGDAFCRSCGAPVVPMKCPRCGAGLEPDDRFCPRCGAPSA